MRALLIAEAVVAAGIAVIGSAADWTAADCTVALLAVCALSLFATGATLGRAGTALSGGALTDPIGRGSVGGTPRALAGVEMVVDDDASAEPDLFSGATPSRRRFPLVPVGLSVASGIAALTSWLVFE